MTKQDSFRALIAVVLIVVGITAFGTTLARAVVFAPTEPEMTASATQTPHAPVRIRGAPVRLVIPSIGVDAAVEDVGVAASGRMAVPRSYSTIGWYRNGPVPGELGSAVMAGHVSNGLRFAGVFVHLRDIQVGDDVYVETDQGKDMHFIVESIAHYPLNQIPSDEIFNRDDAARLNLITCDGDWVFNKRTFDKRIVVYTRSVH